MTGATCLPFNIIFLHLHLPMTMVVGAWTPRAAIVAMLQPSMNHSRNDTYCCKPCTFTLFLEMHSYIQ